MTPIVNGLRDEFDGKVDVIELDAAESRVSQLQQRYGVRGHPSLVLLDAEGQVVMRYLGPQTETELREQMRLLTPP